MSKIIFPNSPTEMPGSFQKNIPKLPDIGLKDFSLKAICKHLENEEIEIIQDLINHCPVDIKKKYLTIDYFLATFKSGDTTCRDPSWHVDGNNNNYVIFCIGDFRTLFATAKYEAEGKYGENSNPNQPQSCARDYTDTLGCMEIVSGVPVIYTSSDIHRGRIADKEGRRLMVRLCYSDYLRPKCMIFKRRP